MSNRQESKYSITNPYPLGTFPYSEHGGPKAQRDAKEDLHQALAPYHPRIVQVPVLRPYLRTSLF